MWASIDAPPINSWFKTKSKDFDLFIKDNFSNDRTKLIIDKFKEENNEISIKYLKGDNRHFANSYIEGLHQIEDEYRSCHTAVSSDGYIFEGHIPSEYITQFLTEKPANALGLSVPGMPHGSPGMEVGNHFMPYDVLVLFKDGTSKVYAQVNR